MLRKVGLFFLSMWLFFLLAIIITIDIPTYFGTDWEFIGWNNLLYRNVIPIIFLICIFIGGYAYYDFKKLGEGATDISFNVEKVDNQNYEHLTFLTTYIVPLVSLNLTNIRYLLVLALLIFVICIIYVRTDLFYSNPTLAILGFKLYKVDGLFKHNDQRDAIILITKDIINIGSNCDYIQLDNRVYYAKLKRKK